MFFRNVLWSLGGTIGVRFIGLITSIFLARMLTPEIFGIVGMAVVFVGFVYVLQEAGLSSVLIQKKSISKQLVVTTFYLNILLSVILAIVIYMAAPSIAALYNQPSIEFLLYYSCIGIVFASIGITHRAILTRDRKFKTLTSIDLIAEIITSVSALLLAFYGYPILAVGLSMLFRPAVQTLCLLTFVSFSNVTGRPSLLLIKEILPFSLNVLGVRLVNFIRNNIDYLVIGVFLGSASLGIYTIAFQWSTVARFYFSQSIARVAFPEVSKYQTDIRRVGQIYLGLLKKISFVTFPLCLGLVVLANEFITTLYKDQWLEVVPVLKILMIAGMVSSIGTIVGAFLKGIGKPDIELKINVFSLISFSILIFIGTSFGLIGIAYAVLMNSITFNIVMTNQLLRVLNLKLITYFKCLSNAFFTSITMMFLIYLLKFSPIKNFSDSIQLCIYTFYGIIVYVILSWFINRDMVKWVFNKVLKR